MKKASPDDDLRAEYDFGGGVRGKYAQRVAKGSNIVVLDRDVHDLFPDSAAVNTALRALAQAVAVTQGARGRARKSRTGTTPGTRKRTAA